MKKIDIKIPDGLTPEKEAVLIAKKILQKQLSSNAKNTNTKLIGGGITIEHTQTQITITRESKEPIIEMVACNACGNQYQNNTALYLWHNYGGKPRKMAVCSKNCQINVISFLGNRAATSKNKLKPFVLFNNRP